jgi:Putative DNA-binding domain
MDERSKPVIDDLFARWERSAQNYEAIVYGAAFFKISNVWQNATTYFAPSRKGEVFDRGFRVDYGSLLLVRGCLPLSQGRHILEHLLEETRLQLPDLPIIEMSASIQSTMVRRHGSHGGRLPIAFSAYEYSFHVQTNNQVHPPHGYVCAVGLPLYPHAYAAIHGYLGVKILNQGTSELTVLAPDYRAKVASVRLAASAISVAIETQSANYDSIIGKAYFEDNRGAKQHFDLLFKGGAATFATGEYPTNLAIVLLSRDEGDVIDEWFYHPAAGLDRGALIETTTDTLEAIIAGGESETVEFKSQVPPGLDLARAICAFANTGGGRIVIGVNDNAELVGCDTTKSQEKIGQGLDHHCDPVPGYQIVTATVGNAALLVITVPEGIDKPYVVKGKGIYIRSGATKRRATRYETDHIYGTRETLTQQ